MTNLAGRWDAAKTGSDCLHRNMEQHDRGGRAERHQNRARNFLCELQAEKHDRDGKNGHGSCRHRKRVPCVGERHHAVKEIAGNVIHFQAEEITDLRAGDQDRNAVGEATTTGRGKYFTILPIPVTPSNTRSTPAIMVHANNPSIPCFATMPATPRRKRPSARQFAFWNRPAAKSGIPSQWRIESRLRESPKQSQTPSQRQRDEAHGHAGNQIGNELMTIVPRNRSMDFGSQASIAGVMAASDENLSPDFSRERANETRSAHVCVVQGIERRT